MKSKTKHIFNIVSNWITINGILFIGWLILSYVEVLIKHGAPNPVYTTWNLFSILIKFFA